MEKVTLEDIKLAIRNNEYITYEYLNNDGEIETDIGNTLIYPHWNKEDEDCFLDDFGLTMDLGFGEYTYPTPVSKIIKIITKENKNEK